MTVELEAERGQQVVILLDCGRLMTARAGAMTKLDHAINAALLLGWLAQQQGDRVGLVTFTDEVESFLAPQRGPTQVNRLSEALYAGPAQFVEPDFSEGCAQADRRRTSRTWGAVCPQLAAPGAPEARPPGRARARAAGSRATPARGERPSTNHAPERVGWISD